MTTFLVHILAAYAILAAPWVGVLSYNKAKRRVQTGDPRAKISLYREIILEQVVLTSVVLILLLLGTPRTVLGLCAPRSWIVAGGIAIAFGALIVYSSLQARRKAEKIRERYKHSLGTILPDSIEEMRLFVAISFGAGICEEMIFRGFLFYYLGLHLPHVNTLEKVLLTSLFFGLAHLYQGWTGVVKTGFAGVIVAGLYVLTGSVMLPMAVHAMADLQVPLIFWPNRAPNGAIPEAT
jgi:uncharacterized protein